MPSRETLRVVHLGGTPADPRHLELAARSVELTVYTSSWLPPNASRFNRVPEGVTVREMAPIVRSGRGPLMFYYRGLKAALDCDAPDVVHVLSEPWGLLAVQAARWVGRNPSARLVLHGCDTLWHHGGPAERWARRRLVSRSLPKTDAWVAENSMALAVATDTGLPAGSRRERIHTNPRDSRLFRRPSVQERTRARAALEIPRGTAAIGLLARLVPEKGVLLFLDAARMLLDRGFPGRFYVAGWGPLGEEVRRRAGGGIVDLGRVPHPLGVRDLFHALDVLACPSLATPFWEDQGPRSVLEAMMCGCVPVATPTGALPEMLGDLGVVAGSTGTVDVAAAITDAVAVADDEQYRREIADRARMTYSAEAVADQLVGLWRAVASRDLPVAGH